MASKTSGEEISKITFLKCKLCMSVHARRRVHNPASKEELIGDKALLLCTSGMPVWLRAIQAAPPFNRGSTQDDATLHLVIPGGGFCHLLLASRLVS